MSPYLLDTHALVWATTAPHRLGGSSRGVVERPDSELVVSAASAWELAIKYHKGRFPEAEPFIDDFERICRQLRARVVPITHQHALRAGGLSWPHRDPFDRVLAAQALQEEFVVITVDDAFDDVVGLRTLW